MARWARRREACEYARIGKTKLDGLIAEGKVTAKKEDGAKNATVFVDLDSVDAYFEAMAPAVGAPRKRTPYRPQIKNQTHAR